ncbi:MAG: TRAP transporter large permease [Dehalococcoidia bacterium]
MVWWAEALIILFAFILMLAAGMPIAFGFGLALVFGALFLVGDTGLLSTIPTMFHTTLTSFIFLCLPLFIFMAEVLEVAGISRDTYDAADKWLSGIPGGLAIANVVACAAFGAVCGSSAVTVATMGRIGVPRLVEKKYDAGLTTGSVASGGSLALMIPPSLAFITYGVLTDVSVGKLFIAGILPGIMLTVLFSIYIVTRVAIKPSLAPSHAGYSWMERLSSLTRVWPIVVLFLGIMASIYLGIATPTESAAIGCVVALVLGSLYRRLTWKSLWTAFLRASATTGLIGLVIVGGKIFSLLFATRGIAGALSQTIVGTGLPPLLVFVAMVLVLFILGMFMEGAGIIVLTIPIFFPIITSLGFDPVWFGVATTVCVELALITPPVGVNVYLLAGIVKPWGITMGQIFKGILPFVVLELIALAILTAFPQIATWLPSMMME